MVRHLPRKQTGESPCEFKSHPLRQILNMETRIGYKIGYKILAYNPFLQLLVSPIRNQFHWMPRQVAEAKCAESSHNPPEFFHECGIFVSSSIEFVEPMYATMWMLCEVFCWGKIVEHQYGFRAQYAYPKRIVKIVDSRTISPSFLESIIERYGLEDYVA